MSQIRAAACAWQIKRSSLRESWAIKAITAIVAAQHRPIRLICPSPLASGLRGGQLGETKQSFAAATAFSGIPPSFGKLTVRQIFIRTLAAEITSRAQAKRL